jgi:lysophospholipase L1-like esterase
MLVQRWILATLVVVVALTSCSRDGDSEGAKPTLPADADSYVALGDSFVSGPGIEPQQRDSGICLRSKRNWPTVLSKELGLSDARDVSCAGASTFHLFNEVSTGEDKLPPQLDALEKSTDLVTLTIGGNDERILQGLNRACFSVTMPARDACSTYVDETLPSILEDVVGPNLSRVLEDIRRRSPDALVLLVGYLRLAPEEGGGCSDLPVRPRQLADFIAGEQAIDATFAAAANKAEVEFLSAYDLSEGHDVCAGQDAWVTGSKPQKGDGAVLHPRASGMRAVADAASAAVR